MRIDAVLQHFASDAACRRIRQLVSPLPFELKGYLGRDEAADVVLCFKLMTAFLKIAKQPEVAAAVERFHACR